MIRKSVKRFSEKIMLKQEAKARWRFNPIPSRFSWIMEEVYGWLAVVALPRATEMVWIDLPIDECLQNI